jgi:hypothetical protein
MPIQPQADLKLKAGARFLYGGRSYRLNSFLCEVIDTPPEDAFLAQLFAEWAAEDDAQVPPGMRRIKLRYCLPEEATYVTGSGVCGCVAAISEIEVVGMVPWPTADLIEHHENALRKGREGKHSATIVRPIPQAECA